MACNQHGFGDPSFVYNIARPNETGDAQHQAPTHTSSSHTEGQQVGGHNAGDSDYGSFGDSDGDDELIERLLQTVESKLASGPDSLEEEPFRITDIEDYEPPRGVRLPKVPGLEPTRRIDGTATQLEILRDFEAESGEQHLSDASGCTDADQRLAAIRTEPENGADGEKSSSAEPVTQAPQPDTRTPLERFRRPPKKALSVTDLVSPAWCELQYFYTLSKHGRKRRTPAMKQGSKVHQELEDEIHITVPVEVLKIEDSWGLRIWNIIQGLRTLRDTGRTRELEILGTVGGEIVNGVIDELSYDCPDLKLQEMVDSKNGKKHVGPELPEYQRTITEYMTAGTKAENGQSISAAMSGTNDTSKPVKKDEKQIYITDIKTRTSPTLPTGSSTRPTILQLHLYHHMLENLAQGNFSLIQLTERYNLDSNATFSDSFIAQVGNLNQEVFEAASSQGLEDIPSSEDSIDILLQHNNLSSLWDYMISQLRLTFLLPASGPDGSIPTSTPQSVSDLPSPASQPTRLSTILTAEYLASNYRHTPGTSKKFLGKKSFVFNAEFLRNYLEDNLAWWRGEREAKGVELQEAWKCRSCDFRDDCEWLHERDRDALEKVMQRKALRDASGAKETKEDKEAMKDVSRSKV